MPLIETKGAASAQGFGEFAPSGAGAANYIEDVFSTYLYTGAGSTNQNIVNGIDLAGKGGLVWIKDRSVADTHLLFDTLRGVTRYLSTAQTGGQGTLSQSLTSFNSNGFTGRADIGPIGDLMASWTFREQAKFFDVVTYTGDGAATREILHNLGSTPGFIIVKKTSSTGRWLCWHRTFPQDGTYILLNSTSAAGASSPAIFTTTVPTSTGFYVSYDAGRNTDFDPNINGQTYVAYLFAHDAGGFGATGSDNVISCGSYTGNGSTTGPVINLGYEPQWLLVKQSSISGAGWYLIDTMRGATANGLDQVLFANSSQAETSDSRIAINATGFQPIQAGGELNASGETCIYIAIRRGPMKTPTSGTSVFKPQIGTGGSPSYTTNFTVDAVIDGYLPGGFGESQWVLDRLRGSVSLASASTAAESSTYAANIKFVYSNGALSGVNDSHVGWVLGRAPGFFDVVCYTGTGSATTQAHNLGAVPELMIVKTRSNAEDWAVYSATTGNTKKLVLNSSGSASGSSPDWWGNTTPTSSVFTVGSAYETNRSGYTYVAYLFATVAGVSKVGSYTGTGTTQQVNCGFTGGARFVLIKRADSSGDWYVWDSARGIVAGDDPYLLLNSTAAEVTNTDYVDTFAAGFEISSTAPAAINANGGTFIFLAIA